MGGAPKPGSGIVQPLVATPDPGVIVMPLIGGGIVGQMSTTLPVTVAVADPFWTMLPFDQTSPTIVVFSVPVIRSEKLPFPPHPLGLSVWMPAGPVPAWRATAVAVAETRMVGVAPSTCMIATGIEWLPVAVKLVPAIE